MLTNALTQQSITDSELGQIAELCKRQLQLESELAELARQSAIKQEELNALSITRIPESMSAIGLECFTLKTGEKVELKSFYSGKISDENKPMAFSWLRDNGHDSIIKNEIIVPLGKGMDEMAEKIEARLITLQVKYDKKESVHAQTLKAFIREQMESGNEFPSSLFGAYTGKVTKITAPK